MFNFRHRIALFLVAFASTALSGCVAKTALDVVTAPVKVVGKAADLATTSQSESDEKRGREIRQREEKLGKLDRKYQKKRQKCADGNHSACEDARQIYDEMQELAPGMPSAPSGT